MLHKPSTTTARAESPGEAQEALAQLPRRFVDQMPWRYELIRPLVLFPTGTATQRAQETGTPPDTIRTRTRRFQRQGLPGLLPGLSQAGRPRPGRHVPPAVVQELARLNALDAGCHYRALVRLLWGTCGYRMAVTTVKTRWEQSPPAAQGARARGAYHSDPERVPARFEVITLSAQGWTKRRLSRGFPGSRPPVHTWSQRFEAEDLAGVAEQRRAPKAPARPSW